MEKVIDGLLIDLYGGEQFSNFIDLTYELKLDYLNRQSEELEEIKNIMRLEGVTLSYDIL